MLSSEENPDEDLINTQVVNCLFFALHSHLDCIDSSFSTFRFYNSLKIFLKNFSIA